MVAASPRFEQGTVAYAEMSLRSSFVLGPNPNSPHATAGFSLIEILCAVLILGVALTGMIQGVTTALSSSKESELQTVAALFAAGQLETLRATGSLRDGTTDGECGEGLSLYHWQQTISAAGIEGLHEVAVIVENAKSGKPIYELRTLLFELPDDSRTTSNTTRRDTGSQRRKGGGTR
jgi:prepilin-type N-terminal cleavage/methylation domain-containing protein